MPNFCDVLIHAGIIITQNETREILKNSSLAIKKNLIADIGPTEIISQKWASPNTLDYSGSLLMPGLVNAHTHAAMTFLRGLADDQPLLKWLKETVFPLEARLTPEIVRIGSMLGHAEMLAHGVTSCIDMYIHEDAVFEAALNTGIRCMGGEAIFGFPTAAYADWQSALAHTEELAELYADSPRIKIAINPHSVYTTTPEILAACRNTAVSTSLPIHIHIAETLEETNICQQQYNCRPVEWLRKNGFFDTQVLGAHVVDINDEEMNFLGQQDFIALHNPSSNMKLASGLSPVCDLLKAGIPVALGSDGPASNNGLNIFSEMKLASLLQKNHIHEPTALPAPIVLDMATLGGASAFGDKNLGSLEICKKADCIALDLKRPNLLPMHNPISQVVYAATGAECVMTMVDGQIVYQDGTFRTFSLDDLYSELDQLHKFVVENR